MSEEKPFPNLTITESGEAILDLSDVNPKPLGKKEIRELETALLIGTLLRPEIIALLRDPIERVVWLESLATAASALARSKAGYTISEIAEELGRSEESIRAHLTKKTKAGKLVSDTYEKLARGELRLITPVIRVPQAEVDELIKSYEKELMEKSEKVEELSKEVEALREELNKREDEIKLLKAELESKSNRLEELEAEAQSLRNEKEKYVAALNKVWELIKAIEDIKASLS